MFRAELPPSVSTEYTPSKFGPGTQRHTRGNHVVYEVHADRRKTGTSLRSRILHVANKNSDDSPTTLVLSPGEEYQTIEIKREGEKVTRAIGVNGTHIKMEVIDNATQQTIEAVRLGFLGNKLEEESPESIGQALEPGIECNLAVAPTLPTKITTELEELLTSVGDIIKNPQQYLPPEHVVALSNIFPEIKPIITPTEQAF
jgi:hypothetical protein